jgi:ATP-dependent Clp protease, protease subunit
MTIRKLPALPNIVTNRSGLGFEATPQALQHWNGAIQAASGDGDATISILEPIGADFFGEGVTAKRIAAALRSIGERDVIVNINSPGGDFFEGVAIYNMLQQHPKKVTSRILGIAASAASVIAMAGDEIQIARAGFIMIHNTQGIVVGDRNDMREVSDALAIFDAAMADVFAARTGLEAKAVARMMDKETVFGSAEAIDQGFADDFLPADAVSEKVKNRAETNVSAMFRRLDVIMAKAGMSRPQRRELIEELKSGTPTAAEDGTPTAAVSAELASVLSEIRIPLN